MHPPRIKVGFYMDAADAARARGAYLALPRTATARTWSDFLSDAVLKEVQRLEAEHNGGRPWPEAAAGDLPPGRPMAD